jgi:hypothetical protein
MIGQRTAYDIASLIEKHADDPMQFALGLTKIKSNKSFRDSAESIVRELVRRGYKANA